MTKLTILIADDHPVFRDGIRMMLDSEPDVELVGEAHSGGEAIELAEQLQPDVILMDIKMDEVSGIEATRQITQTNPNIRVLIVTMFEEPQSVFSAMRAGAMGYISKNSSKSELMKAVHIIGNRGAVFGPAIAEYVQSFFANPALSLPNPLYPDLTERERQVLEMIGAGKNNSQIADKLSLSPKTVANYVSNIFSKLQVADRAMAIIKAREAGLGQGVE